MHRHEKKADDPERALLILPLETIQALNTDGWPVAPGDLGENVTTEGIAYHAFTPGSRFRLGSHVEMEITKPCDPCTFLYGLPYVGPQRGPAFLKTLVGRRGWYARVVKPGRLRAGEAIEPL